MDYQYVIDVLKSSYRALFFGASFKSLIDYVTDVFKLFFAGSRTWLYQVRRTNKPFFPRYLAKHGPDVTLFE
jgi:hypothetical protein